MGLALKGVNTLGLIPQSYSYFNQMAVQPSLSFKLAVNEFIYGCIIDGSWSLLDAFWLLATETEQQATLNMVNPTGSALIKVGSPTFVASQGYTGVTTTGYLRSQFIPSVNGVNYTLDNCVHGIYSRTQSQTNNYDMGCSDAANDAWIISRSPTNVTAHRTNQSSGGVAGATTSSLGFICAVRTASNLSTAYQNGAALAPTSNIVSTALPTREFYILTRNGNGTPASSSERQISLAFIGSGSINQSAFYTRVQKLATTIGFNV